jgi:hypothetical protein
MKKQRTEVLIRMKYCQLILRYDEYFRPFKKADERALGLSERKIVRSIFGAL